MWGAQGCVWGLPVSGVGVSNECASRSTLISCVRSIFGRRLHCGWTAFSLMFRGCRQCFHTASSAFEGWFPTVSCIFQPVFTHPLGRCFGGASLVKSRCQTRSLPAGVIVPKGPLKEKLPPKCRIVAILTSHVSPSGDPSRTLYLTRTPTF